MKDNKAMKYITLITGVLTLLLGIYTLVRPMVQCSMYSVSRRTTSSKSVISLRPLTCHIPVIPGLVDIRLLW